ILQFAEAEARRVGLANVATRVMDGENLEVENEAFDEVISRVGLIYFPDQLRALGGMLRALKPGGRAAAIVYSTPDRNEFFSIPVMIIRRRAHLSPPAPGQPGPFSLGAPGAIEDLFVRAGFGQVTARRFEAPLGLASAADCVRFERESFGALHQMLSGLTSLEREAAWTEIQSELGRFEGPEGFSGPCELVVAVGTKAEST
ncbi:MAG: class I SAM-dependent methyltransferase, partial [Actinomycetota bacterium]